MIELVLTACLLAAPDRCEQRYIETALPMSLFECMVTSQQHLVRWREQHPNWRVARWSCGYPRA